MKFIHNKKLIETVQSLGMSNIAKTVADAKEEDISFEINAPVDFGGSYMDSEKAKKHFMKVIDEKTKDAMETVPENPSVGKPLEKNMYTKLSLDESLFEATSNLSPDAVDQKPGFEDWPEDEAEAKKECEKFIGKWISELDPGEYDLYNTLYQDLVHNPTAAGGNIPGPKGYRATADRELQDIDSAIGTFSEGITVKAKDIEGLEKAKKIALRYRDYGVFYETKDFNDKAKYYTKQLFIFVPTVDDVERDPETLRQPIDAKREAGKLTEARVISSIDLANYDSTEAGNYTLDKIREAGKIRALENILDEIYPNGINEITLDDILGYERDWLFDMLGIKEEDDESDEDEE